MASQSPVRNRKPVSINLQGTLLCRITRLVIAVIVLSVETEARSKCSCQSLLSQIFVSDSVHFYHGHWICSTLLRLRRAKDDPP